MSQTKLNIVVRRVLTSIPKFVCFLQAGAIILAMVLPASAAQIWWRGTSSTLWDNNNNWNLTGPSPATANPGSPSGNDVIFTADSASSTPTVNNEVNTNTTINSLSYSQQDPSSSSSAFQVTKIDTGVTLRISGSYTYTDTSIGIQGPVSLSAGNLAPFTTVGAEVKSQTAITGGGTLNVDAWTGSSTTSGDIVVREVYNNRGPHTAIMDLSGLNTFNANVDQMLVGYSAAANSANPQYQEPTGTIYLARNNSITLNSTANSASSVGLIIGYANGNGNGPNAAAAVPSNLYLGQSNIINVNNVWVGDRKSMGNMLFNSAFSNPTLVMRGSDGTSRVSTIVIGDNYNITTSNAQCSGSVNFNGGSVDVLADAITVGRDNNCNSYLGSSYPSTGTLSFNAGNINANTLTIGLHVGNGTSTVATGTVNVAGTAQLTINTGLSMASFGGGTVGQANGTLNISGGTVTMGGNIDKGATPSGTTVTYSNATISLTGGTLDMQGHNIGTSSVPIDNFTIHGGTVTNLNNLAVTNFTAAGDASLPSGTLTIGNGGKIDMRDGAAHTLSATNLTLAGASTLYYELSNNTSSGNDLINLTGAFNYSSSGMTMFISRLGSSFASGTYTLINYGSYSGVGALSFTNTTRSSMTPHLGANALTLDVTNVAGHDLTWNGTTNGTWDVINSSNKPWTSVQLPTPDMYFDGDNVTFGTQSGTTTITLYNNTGPNGFVPNSVTVNSSTDYIFNGSGPTDKISGTTGLTKNGTGTLTINLPNDYLGTTYLNAGKIILGNATALGSASAPLIIANNATLDLNVQQLYAKPVTVQGSGTDGNGAIVNNSSATPGQTQFDLSNLTLSGNTTIGGLSSIDANNSGLPGSQYVGRWAMRAQTGSATLSTGGHAYNLTKVGNNQIMLVNTNTDTALADVFVNKGVLSLEGTTTLGNPANTVTVDGAGAGQPAGGSMLQFRNLTVALDKQVLLKNNGQLYALVNGTATDNTIAGTVAIDSTGGILNAGGLRDDYLSNTPNAAAAITISGAISGSGPLTKTGPGTVTLTNPSSTFNGPTTLNDGILVVNGAIHGSVTMNTSLTSGTTTVLAGNGTISGSGATVTDAPSTVIAPGPAYSPTSSSVGTLTLNNLTINSSGGGTIKFDLSPNTSSGNDLLSLNGNLTLTPATMTNIAITEISGPGTISNGTYNLINYNGTKTGTALANLHLMGLASGSRRTYALDDSILHQINLNVSGSSASLVWKGDGSSNTWDVANASNHVWTGDPLDAFYNLDSVSFTNAGDNTVPIYITSSVASVQPSSIIVNAGKDYTFSGPSKITGATGLSKSGSGTLILANGSGGTTNDFSGPITINGGILQIGNGTANASIGTGSITNNSQLIFYQTDNYTVTGVINGSGSLEQKGSGVLTLSGSNNYNGVTLISSGTLQAGNNSALGSTAAGTTIASGGTLDINNMNLGSEPIFVQGQGVGNNGAIVNSNTATSTAPQQALRFVTLTGDTTFGFGGLGSTGIANSARWDIRGTTSSPSTLSTGGHAYNLTKVGSNQVSLVATNVDSKLANVNINQGVLELELTSTLGDPTMTVTVDGSSGAPDTYDGATLQMYNLATPLNKIIVLQNGGSIYAKNNNLATDNTVAGPVTIADWGGTLNAGGARSDIATANANTTMTFNGGISGSSSAILTKNGPGTVILNSTNTFAGTTYLNDGTLIVNGSLSGAVTMSASTTTINGVTIRTTLGGNGTIGGAVQDATGTTIIAPGATAASGSVGTLTFSSDLMLGSYGPGQINMDLSSDPSGTIKPNDQIIVRGNLSLGSYVTTVQINPVNGYLGIGAYHLINYTSLNGSNLALSGAPSNTRQTYSISVATPYIDLVVNGTAPANLVWAGGQNANTWDIKSTINWTGADGKFYNADQVTFDNTGLYSQPVNIGDTLSPGSVTVNSTQNYTFSGAGKISGGTGLTKQGAGTLTLATTNDYSGQTTVTAGTLLVTGSVGNNSAVLINGGTLQAGSSIALGTNNTNGTTITSGTLDINAMDLQSEPITVQGAGVGSNGAIVNSGAGQSNALTNVTLSGNTTFGGSGEWDIRGTSASLSTTGLSYNLTKTGTNTIDLVSVAVDTALGDITINQGVLKFEDSTTFGDASKTVTIASSGTLQFLKSANAMAKHIESNGGTISASSDNLISQDIVSGTVAVNGSTPTKVNANNAAGILSFTNLISGNGGLDKTGPGTVIITGMPSYNGDTAIDGGILQVNTAGSAALHNVTGTAALGVGDGSSATNLTASTINIGTLTIAAGSKVTIAAIPGGPSAGAPSISPVPEPATWAMLILAAMGLGIYRRRTR